MNMHEYMYACICAINAFIYETCIHIHTAYTKQVIKVPEAAPSSHNASPKLHGRLTKQPTSKSLQPNVAAAPLRATRTTTSKGQVPPEEPHGGTVGRSNSGLSGSLFRECRGVNVPQMQVTPCVSHAIVCR